MVPASGVCTFLPFAKQQESGSLGVWKFDLFDQFKLSVILFASNNFGRTNRQLIFGRVAVLNSLLNIFNPLIIHPCGFATISQSGRGGG